MKGVCPQAFTEYFRTEELVEGKDLIIVPCDEGNGSGLVGCNGILVTHLWMRPAEEVRGPPCFCVSLSA